VRVFDITDPFAQREVAHFVPPAPETMVDPRPNRPHHPLESAEAKGRFRKRASTSSRTGSGRR
jgi:hypothetical protein